jgi:hypothetical protein
VRGEGISGDDAGPGRRGAVIEIADQLGFGLRRNFRARHDLGFVGVGIADGDERLIAVTEKRIAVGDGLQAGNGSGPLFARGIEFANFELALGENFLHFAETLLGARDERRVGELLEHGAVFLLGMDGILRIAVRLFHLLEVDVADLHLRLGGLRRIGEEGDEVLVFGFGLGERGGATLLEPGIADEQLGAHGELGIRVGVEQGLEVEARHVVLAMLHGVVWPCRRAPCRAASS